MIQSEKKIIQGNWSLNIIQCVLTKLSSWDLADGSAPFWRLYANFSGNQLLFFKNQRVELTPENMVIIPPNTSYQGVLKSPEAYHFFIHFSLSHPIYPIKPQLITLSRSPEMRALLRPLERGLNKPAAETMEDFSLCVIALTALSLAGMENPIIARPPWDYRVERVLEAMDKNLSEKQDMNEWAHFANLSSGGLTRLFRENTGQTPLFCLNEKRINRACELLHDTRLSLEEVAEQCGFTNRYYFTRVFKKYRRNTPAAFRKMIE